MGRMQMGNNTPEERKEIKQTLCSRRPSVAHRPPARWLQSRLRRRGARPADNDL